MKKIIAVWIVFFVLCFANIAWAETFKVDPDHTTVTFKIRHLLGYVHGNFEQFEGTIDYDPDKPELSKTSGTIKVEGLNTRVKERDKHLKSADFFDVKKYPEIKFTSTKVLKVTQDGGQLEGLLTIHGVEKKVILDVENHGILKDPWGNTRLALTATTKINRKDFGLTWNQVIESGQVLVGDEVFITVEVEGIR